MPLLSRNLKIQYPREKLIPYKSLCIVEKGTKLISNLRKYDKQTKTVFKANYIYGIASLSNTARKLLLKTNTGKKFLNVKKFEVPEKQVNSIQTSCIPEDATKSISKLRKFEHQTRNRFQTKLCLKNCFFV